MGPQVVGWDRQTEIVLVIGRKEEAHEYIDLAPKGIVRLYVWAPRWANVVGHNPERTSYVCAGEWWRSEECERAVQWCKDKGYTSR